MSPDAQIKGRRRRASGFVSRELGALRELRPRVGIHRAIVERVKWNLELDRVDNAAVSALVAELEATRADVAATREALGKYARLAEAMAAHIELGARSAAHVAGAPILERLLALGYWLTEQPPSELPVSVIIPTRSRPALVSQAIASVQAQSHPHWELIVVDDGSTDETRATLAAIDDDRVRSLRTDGLGSPGARSAGLQIAGGEAIAYLDDDNVMLPGWLAAVAWAFSHFEEFDVLYGARVVEDESPIGSAGQLPRLVFSHFDRNRLLEGNYIDASVIAHRANLPQARWDSELAGVADWDLMLRLTEDKPALALPVVAALYGTSAPDRQTHAAAAHASELRLRARLGAKQR